MTSRWSRVSLVLFLAVSANCQRVLTQAGAPVETCGSDQEIAQPIPLSTQTIALAADGRLFSPCLAGDHGPAHREVRERDLLNRAAASSNVEHRRLATQAFGRLASPAMATAGDPATPTAGPLIALLADSAPAVRAEAANAIGQSLAGARSDLRTDAPASPAQTAFGRAALEARLADETVDEVAEIVLETLGRLRYEPSEVAAVEGVLVAEATASPERLLGAAKGLEALARRNPRYQLSVKARARLRDLAGLGRRTTATAAALSHLRRVSMQALQVARDNDTTTMIESAKDPDWQVRRIAVLMMNPSVDLLAPAVEAAMKDESMHVRIEAIRTYARGLQRTGVCGPIVAAMSDGATLVSLQAMDTLAPNCQGLPEIVANVAAIADELKDPAKAAAWHRPARALTTLSRIAPDEARKRLGLASGHAVWQVRATGAATALTLVDEGTLVKLAADPIPNVRTAAIEALARMKSPSLVMVAIAALTSDDHQLVRAAALALRGIAAPGIQPPGDAVAALFTALRRLTAQGKDTSRDPRVAIIDRLAELLPAGRAEELVEWAGDFDAGVRDAAMRSLVAAKLYEPGSPPPPRRFRYPQQPTAQELQTLPTRAEIVMTDGGTVELELLGTEAPMTVARFAALARQGHYNGLTFHRVVANFVVQGGSPGASEYVGDARYMRDETGRVPHLRGAVGISTRGYDTGDAQVFFDLVDIPRLDHDYTVFARVTSGMDVVDRMLEGATMKTVTVR